MAGAYIERRFTYRADRATGAGSYAEAVTAAAVSTAQLAERNRPSAADVRRIEQAKESCVVKVLATDLATEAENTRRTKHVLVHFIARPTYAGEGSGSPVEHVWSLQLHASPAGRWRVAAVEITD